MSVDLSIVIVTYNSQNYIADCLDSVFRQAQYFHTEVIVVDNASTDDTVDSIRRFEDKNVPLHLITNEVNRLFAPAVNQGLQQSRGDYLFILNPDTRLEPESLELLYEYFRGDRSIGVIAPQLRNPDGSIQPSCRRFPRHRDVVFHTFGLNQLFSGSPFFNGWKMGDFDHRQTREVDQPQGAALFTSRVVVHAVGSLNEDFPMFFNDVDWCYRVKQAGYKILFYPQAQVTHIQGASVNSRKAAMVVSSHVSFFRFFEKHYDRVYHQPINLIAGLLLFFSIPFRVVGVWVRSLLNKPD